MAVPRYAMTSGRLSLPEVALFDNGLGTVCQSEDAQEYMEDFAALRQLEFQGRGARTFYGHDPEFWRGVPQAPERTR